jgi:CubicO group peptidase (beta-lactamase class C family)
MRDKTKIITKEWIADQENGFSGVLTVFDSNEIIFNQASGFRNISEELPNVTDTAFAIASGTKLFTGIAVCKLIESGKLALDTLLCDIVKQDLGQIDKSVTIRHLLTHTSGIGDYIDEEADDIDELLETLYTKYPPHLWTNMEYYLQMTTHLPPKFVPGERYSYSNSGYVLLGLVVEAASGKSYQDFVMDEIITPLELTRSGFYRSDNLPANTALGYLEDGRTNVHCLPVHGGADGGLYSCATDMDKL